MTKDNLIGRLPKLGHILAVNRKLADGMIPDPGPDSGHPATPEGNISVPSGETISTADAESKKILGKFSVANGDSSAAVDSTGVTIGTEVAQGGDVTSLNLPVDAKIPDPGPDSHPASPNNQKSAAAFDAYKTPAELASKLASMLAEVRTQLNELAAPAAPAQPAPAPADVMTPQKTAELLLEIVPPEMREKTAAYLEAQLEPVILDAMSRAQNLLSYIKLAEMDPAAAEAMMSADPAAMGGDPMGGAPVDPAMGGGAPMGGDPMGGAPMGGDPSMGGAPGMGGGGDPMQELEAAIAQVAQEYNTTPDQIMQMLMSAQGGGDAGGGAPAPDAGGPPAPPAGGPPSEPSSEKSDEGSEPTPEPEADTSEGGKTAAGKVNREVLRKLAAALATEIGKTPQQVAAAC